MERLLACTHCSRVWHYKGRGKFYATCPSCLRKVKIKDAQIYAKKSHTRPHSR